MHASYITANCTICKTPLDPVLPDAGYRTHPCCDPVEIRRAALAAAARGWACFPCAPGRKTPRAGLRWPQAATADPDRLGRARWQPGENYGIACKPSGLVVLDLDTAEPGAPDGWDVLAALADDAGEPWPLTYTVRTPTGGGHLYFLADPGRPIGNRPLDKTIDVRGGGEGEGGYVLGAGSWLDQRAYPDKPVKAAMVRGGRPYAVAHAAGPVPLPAWIAARLDPQNSHNPQKGPADEVVRVLRVVRGTAYAEAALRGELDRLLSAAPGTRNNTLNEVTFKLGQLVADGQLDAGRVTGILADAAHAIGLSGPEVAHTVASGLAGGLNKPRWSVA